MIVLLEEISSEILAYVGGGYFENYKTDFDDPKLEIDKFISKRII